MSRKLALSDILDLRAYENRREEFMKEIIELKARRRVQVGPYVTFVFENRDTMLFQIQEMARAERMLRDEQIQGELEAYNPLIPEARQLSATLLLELRNQEELREWLPKLVGIEITPYLQIGDERVNCIVDPAHARQLTREQTTSSVHYVFWELTEDQVEAFEREDVVLGVDHANYQHSTPLSPETKASLLRRSARRVGFRR